MDSSYRVSFACLDCRKVFKRSYEGVETFPQTLKCPHCSGVSHNFGRHFKAPKQTDTKQWKKISYLLNNGFRFQKIRIGPKHHDTVPYPETLEQAKYFVVKYKQYAIPTKTQQVAKR